MKSEFRVDAVIGPDDVDASGSAHFTAYARLVDVAENACLGGLGFDAAELARLGAIMRRVHLEFDFYKPVGTGDALSLRTRVAGVGAHSVRLSVEAHRAADDAQVAAWTVVTACVDAAGRSAPLPPDLAIALRSEATQG
jgi:acyl-CoA thioesterase FadM